MSLAESTEWRCQHANCAKKKTNRIVYRILNWIDWFVSFEPLIKNCWSVNGIYENLQLCTDFRKNIFLCRCSIECLDHIGFVALRLTLNVSWACIIIFFRYREKRINQFIVYSILIWNQKKRCRNSSKKFIADIKDHIKFDITSLTHIWWKYESQMIHFLQSVHSFFKYLLYTSCAILSTQV